MKSIPFLLTLLLAISALASRNAKQYSEHSTPGVGDTVVPHASLDVDAATDSMVQVVAYFNRLDTTEYYYESGKLKIDGSDTTLVRSIGVNFRIVVLDSTDRGYRIEYCPLSVDFAGDSEKSAGFEEVLKVFSKSMVGKKIHARLSPLGELQHIENWKELRDSYKKLTTSVIDSVYKDIPGLDSIVSRKQLEALVSTKLDSEEGIKNSFEELSLLFTLHGTAINTQDSIVYREPNAIITPHTVIRAGVAALEEEVDEQGETFDGDYYVTSHSVAQVPQKMIQEVLGGVLNLLNSRMDEKEIFNRMGKELKDTKFTLTNDEYYEYFVTGWPKDVITKNIIELSGLENGKQRTATQVRYKSLQWTKRSWFNY